MVDGFCYISNVYVVSHFLTGTVDRRWITSTNRLEKAGNYVFHMLPRAVDERDA
jgi:hypothetical protein